MEKDEATPIREKGFFASPPEAVLKVLKDGRVSDEVIRQRIRLVKGWFEQTLPKYEGRIALLHLDCDLYESYEAALKTLYCRVERDGAILFDEYGDARWRGASKAIDRFFHDKPERIRPHPVCSWKYHVIKQ